MSAIYGFAQWPRDTFDPAAFDAMTEALRHYAHDGSGAWHHANIALGHHALDATRHADAEKFPFEDPESGLAVTADARLDNRADLCAELGLPPAPRTVLSNGTLIAWAYRKWGTDCPKHLIGDFAFALWDPAAQQFFAARDHMGIRPLFYAHQSGSHFVFASDILGVLAMPGVEGRRDRARLDLSSGWFPNDTGAETYFEDIRLIPPGHALTASAHGLDLRCYWAPVEQPELRLENEAAYADRVREVLTEAIRCRIDSTANVGCHISGGLDCTTAAVIANEFLMQEAKRIVGYSWSPAPRPEDYPLTDERRYVEAAAAMLGIKQGKDLHYTELTAATLEELQARDVATEPTTFLNHDLVIQRKVHHNGVRTLISGWGGDDGLSFNGAALFPEYLLTGQWGLLWREINAMAAVERVSPLYVFKERVLLYLTPNWIKHVRDLAKRDPLRRAHAWKKLRHYQPGLQYRFYPPFMRKRQLARLKSPGIAMRLVSWNASAAPHGLTYVYPFLDKRVVELSLALPKRLYFTRGYKRYIYRLAVQGIFPEGMQWTREKRDEAMQSLQQQLGRDMQNKKNGR
ncbi:MAG: hypothetical protein HYV27_21240 [Candidatus Hydrogenedentes bacterium]|nr:hypothetical protein [Candidatus Hydrogenedentota bacterium]